MLEVRNIRKAFGNQEVLSGISFSIEKGDVAVILGPSGSGKTTLLRCLEFFEQADSGEVLFDDIDVDLRTVTKEQIKAIRKKTAFVFQNYNLFNNKTALENVLEGLVIGRKIPKKEAETIAKKALDKVGLSDKYDYYPGQLSGGQQQRVGIARAIALSPEIIFFDEPTSALDPELIGEVLTVMRKIAQEGTTMLVVTHEMSFAQDVANKIIFMDGGNIVEEGTPRQIFTEPKEERTRQFLKRMLPEYTYYI